jgi:hypothetical protein
MEHFALALPLPTFVVPTLIASDGTNLYHERPWAQPRLACSDSQHGFQGFRHR